MSNLDNNPESSRFSRITAAILVAGIFIAACDVKKQKNIEK